MDKRLGRFELIEQIDVGGYTTVYRASEDMGEGIKRPTAVKVLQAWNLDDEEQLARLKREAGMLVDIGEAPNIVSVHGMGIDAEMGPWIAMELAGRSLKYAIDDRPTDPNNVRVLLRDVLHALRWVHGVEPPILHRDLKPQNILSTGPGLWKVADFGLAKRAGAEETMQLATVKYAAPELLDSTLGEESPKVDIYALGMIAYEMALGNTLFRKQFPSVYDPSRGSKESEDDDRPKWMYWHTSMQMKLAPLSELIEGYPKDLSDLVAAMIAKPSAERLGTADEALAQLGEVTVSSAVHMEEEESDDTSSERAVSPVIAGAALVAVLILAVAGLLWFFSQGKPRIELDGEPLFVGNSSLVSVACRIVNPPEGSKVQVSLGRSGAKYFDLQPVDGTGRWEGSVRLDGITTVEGTLAIVRGRERLVSRRVQIQRTPPERVEMTLRAARDGREAALVAGVEIRLLSADRRTVYFEGETNARGEVRAEVPYGPVHLEAGHPRFQAFVNTNSRGEPDPIRPKADGSSRLTIPLVPKAFAEIRARMKWLTDELLRLARLKTDCPNGVPEITDAERNLIVEYCRELTALADGNASLVNFVDRIEKVRDCDPSSVPPAPPLPIDPDLVAGDPLALIAELTAEIDFLTWVKVNCTNPPDPELSIEDEARRQQLLTQLEEVLRASGLADSASLIWIRKMRNVVDCDPTSIPAKPPGAIGDNPYNDPDGPLGPNGPYGDRDRESAGRDRAGDREVPTDPDELGALIDQLTAEIEYLTWVKVNCSDPPNPEITVADEERRQQLLSELENALKVSALATGESLIWIKQMRDVKDCDPSSIPPGPPPIGDPRNPDGRGSGSDDPNNPFGENFDPDNPLGLPATDPGELSDKDKAKNEALKGADPALMLELQRMSLNDFTDYVQRRVPPGAVTVTQLPDRDDVRIEGPIFDSKDIFTLYVRLREAILIERIEDELRIEGWELARTLRADMSEEGAAGPRVDAWFGPSDPTLFVQYQAGSMSPEAVRTFAERYIVNPGLLWLRGYEDVPIERPTRSIDGDAESSE